MGGLWSLAAKTTYSEESGLRRIINGEKEGNRIGSKMKPSGGDRMEVQTRLPDFEQGEVHWENFGGGLFVFGGGFLKRP